jgi:polyisoprenoid-binding protein YceI
MTAASLQTLLQEGTLAGDWVLDQRTSSLQFRSKAFGLPVAGSFRQISGNGTVFPGGGISGTLTVAASSIDTGSTRRDRHLRSADFFDSGNHPDITFTADGVRPADQGVAVTGTLTVRGRTRPVSFDAVAAIQGDGEIWLDAEVRINRADFGLTWKLMGMVPMHSTVTIHAVFVPRHHAAGGLGAPRSRGAR